MYINYKLNFRYQIMRFTYWNNKWYPDNDPANWRGPNTNITP